MRIYFQVPSLSLLMQVLLGALVGFVVIGRTTYPSEEWSGVLFVWALSYTAVHIGVTGFNKWALKGMTERFEKILGVDDVVEFFKPVWQSPSLTIGFFFAFATILLISTGASLVVIGLVLAPLGFTPPSNGVLWTGIFIMLVGAVGLCSQILMVWIWLRLIKSLPDEGRDEIVAKIKQRTTQEPSSKSASLVAKLNTVVTMIVVEGIVPKVRT